MGQFKPITVITGLMTVIGASDGIDPSIVPSSNGGTSHSMGTARKPIYFDYSTNTLRIIASPDYIDPSVLPASTGGTGGPGIVDAVGNFTAMFSDSIPSQSDVVVATNIATSSSDTVPAQVDAATIRLSYADTNASPSDSKTDTFITAYCTTAAGTNVTNPTNAQGVQDGTVATMAPTLTAAATLTCTVTNIPTSGTFTTKKLLIWMNFTAAKGALDTWTFTYKTTSITTAQTITGLPPAAATSYLVTPFSLDVSSLTLAQLQGLVVTFADTSAAGDAYTIDAVALRLEGGL